MWFCRMFNSWGILFRFVLWRKVFIWVILGLCFILKIGLFVLFKCFSFFNFCFVLIYIVWNFIIGKWCLWKFICFWIKKIGLLLFNLIVIVIKVIMGVIIGMVNMVSIILKRCLVINFLVLCVIGLNWSIGIEFKEVSEILDVLRLYRFFIIRNCIFFFL